jgi:hypothetical protein
MSASTPTFPVLRAVYVMIHTGAVPRTRVLLPSLGTIHSLVRPRDYGSENNSLQNPITQRPTIIKSVMKICAHALGFVG